MTKFTLARQLKKKFPFPNASACGFPSTPFSQDDYLNITRHWLRYLGVSERVIADSERDALNWALSRGSRSGRVAWQFACDLAGQKKITRKNNQ